MFNFANMDDYEFEMLSKDILEQELGEKLRTYKQGRDGGIDIKSFLGTQYVVQVKHYLGTPFTGLKRSLRNELDKVKTLNPKRYYVVISNQLTPANVEAIYEMFKEYMDSSANIYDGVRINDILEQEKSKDIVKKHYKLWLMASNVLSLVNNQDIFIDTEELMLGIENDSKYFVETKAYREALDIMKKEGIIIIQGEPGAGKTTISKMLLLYYANQGYAVRYASNNSITGIKNTLSSDRYKKEVIIMDDFLGQHYLKLTEEQPNEMKTLMSYILHNVNKKLIMNSRVTILNEALRVNERFYDFIQDNNIMRYLVNLDNMSKEERALIFYNHLYFNELPRGYFENLIFEKRYKRIIMHNNYSPRIIEYVTKSRNYNQINPNEYFGYVQECLNNPSNVWNEEFTVRLINIDRILINTLYSLADGFVECEYLKECFEKRISALSEYDPTVNMFEQCLLRLINGLVKQTVEKGVKKVGVLNPSINDYVYNSLKKNVLELYEISKWAVYIEQIEKIRELNEETYHQIVKRLIETNQYINLKSFRGYSYIYLLKYIRQNNYKNIKANTTLVNIITAKESYEIKFEHLKELSQFIIGIFEEKELVDFYGIIEILENIEIMEILINNICYENIEDIIRIFDLYITDLKLKERFKEAAKERLNDALSVVLNDVIRERIGDITSECIANAQSKMIEKWYDEEWYDEESGELEKLIETIIEGEVGELIITLKEEINIPEGYKDIIQLCPQEIIRTLHEDEEIQKAIEEYFEQGPYDYDDLYDEYRENRGNSRDYNEDNVIEDIFER